MKGQEDHAREPYCALLQANNRICSSPRATGSDKVSSNDLKQDLSSGKTLGQDCIPALFQCSAVPRRILSTLFRAFISVTAWKDMLVCASRASILYCVGGLPGHYNQ